MRTYHFNLIAVIILITSMLFALFSGVGVSYAATTNYSDVLDDLKRDSTFNIADYPAIADDYSLKVIQVAESIDGELFIYVYQPAAKSKLLIANSINMALSEKISNTDTSYTPTGEEFSGEGFGGWADGGHGGGGFRPRPSSLNAVSAVSEPTATPTELYYLSLLSSQGVFAKYRVNSLKVSEDTKRYYNLTSIYRDWDITIDEEADNDNVIDKVAFKVSQLWTATTTDEGVTYECKEIETVKLTSQMIGMRRYSDGFQFDGTKSCDSHYIAFTCDHKIDKLISADVEFSTRTYKTLAGSGTTYSARVPHRVSLFNYQVAGNDGSGWFGKKEDWHRMTTVKEFSREVELTADEKQTLSKYDWILNFYESEYKNEAGGKDVLISGLLPFGFIWTIINACTTTGELVFDVSLLRLEFKYDGQIYNLGVVSDVQTGTNKPTNGGFDLFAWLADKLGVPVWAAKAIFYGIIILIVLAIALPLLSAFFPVVGQVLLWIVKGLGYIISSPVRFIGWIIRKIRGE